MPVIPMGNSNMSQALGDMARVQQQRFTDQATGRPTRMVGGPAPDPAWDAFYGAMQRKSEEAGDAGMGFKMRLAGQRDGNGNSAFGRKLTKMNAPDPNDAVAGLMRSVARNKFVQ